MNAAPFNDDNGGGGGRIGGVLRVLRRHGRRVARVSAQRVEVNRPGRLPPAARVQPLLTLYLEEDERAAAAPQLNALFALLDEVGAAAVHDRTTARTSWRMLGREHPRVALFLEISKPTEARGLVEVTMDAEDYREVWSSVRDAHWIGITTDARLRRHEDGSAAALDEVFAACIPIASTPPPDPRQLTHARR
jgi:hypothetical protein